MIPNPERADAPEALAEAVANPKMTWKSIGMLGHEPVSSPSTTHARRGVRARTWTDQPHQLGSAFTPDKVHLYRTGTDSTVRRTKATKVTGHETRRRRGGTAREGRLGLGFAKPFRAQTAQAGASQTKGGKLCRDKSSGGGGRRDRRAPDSIVRSRQVGGGRHALRPTARPQTPGSRVVSGEQAVAQGQRDHCGRRQRAR